MAAAAKIQQIGNYQIVGTLGRGGMAEVLLGHAHAEGGLVRPVAIKRLLTHLLDDNEAVEMFIDEARICSGLHHPNIVQVFEFGQHSDNYFIAMEYVHGRSLTHILRKLRARQQPLPHEVSAHITASVCAALHYAHARTDADGGPMGIVHRDVNPNNVLISVEGDVKLIDFGVARAKQRIHHTLEMKIKGSLAYMSPEQASAGVIDHRSDIFSVGTMLYVQLTGINPFYAENDGLTIERVRLARVRAPSEIVDLPPELEQACMRAMRRAPERRFANAAEMQEVLERFYQRHGFGAAQLKQWLHETFPGFDPDGEGTSPGAQRPAWQQTRQASAQTPTPAGPPQPVKTRPDTPSGRGQAVRERERAANPAALKSAGLLTNVATNPVHRARTVGAQSGDQTQEQLEVGQMVALDGGPSEEQTASATQPRPRQAPLADDSATLLHRRETPLASDSSTRPLARRTVDGQQDDVDIEVASLDLEPVEIESATIALPQAPGPVAPVARREPSAEELAAESRRPVIVGFLAGLFIFGVVLAVAMLWRPRVLPPPAPGAEQLSTGQGADSGPASTTPDERRPGTDRPAAADDASLEDNRRPASRPDEAPPVRAATTATQRVRLRRREPGRSSPKVRGRNATQPRPRPPVGRDRPAARGSLGDRGAEW